jgi:preprotein translocase subunit SecY
MHRSGETYLPLRVNMAAVSPVNFAASIMAIPPTIGSLIRQNRNTFAPHVAAFFNHNGMRALPEIGCHSGADLREATDDPKES